MKKKLLKSNKGFTLTEALVAVTVIGILSAVSIPSYVNQVCRTDSSEAEATIGSLQAIISGYIDETGTFPTTWNELNTYSAIMTSNGQAEGKLEEPIELPSRAYQIEILGPKNTGDSEYKINATRSEGCEKRDIYACLDVSNGASDMSKGNGASNAKQINCT